MRSRLFPTLVVCTSTALLGVAAAADQTKLGEGNAKAVALAGDSPMVQSARLFVARQINRIQDANLRQQTLDIARNPDTCIAFRAGVNDAQKASILQKLLDAGLVDPGDDAKFSGGLRPGVFPPLRDDGLDCPKLPQPFFSAPGSSYGGHHSYPGGLVIHEAFNSISDMNLAAAYRKVYGFSRSDGMPVINSADTGGDDEGADVFISQDIIVAAPVWHDFTKTMVFQWNADGSEFAELNFGGNGKTDAWGAAGDSKTGGHHIMAVAEAMKRGLAPDFVIAQASAHSAPTSGNEYKVVNWIRAAAMLAQVDPVAQGYLYTDSQNRLRLAPLRLLGSMDLVGGSLAHTNVLAEYVLHNLSDADFTLTGPAITEIQAVLAAVAPQFGFNPSDTATYNTKFRNPVLSYLTAERLLILYGNGGTDAVAAEISKIRSKLTAQAARALGTTAIAQRVAGNSRH